jgi:AcrR family transcriptional regulator
MLKQERMTRDFERRCSDIREIARDLLARQGIGNFTIERVADEAGYARTGIYRFFASKRDLLLDLAIESLELRLELYRRASLFEGRPRERLVAFGEVSSLLYPRHVIPQALGQATWERPKRRNRRVDRLQVLQTEDEQLIAKVARDAVEAGDLVLGSGMTLEETLFALHALTQGIFARFGSLPPPEGVADPRGVLRRAGGRLLDGLGWRPLSHEWDYRETISRVYREVFTAGLLARLGLAGDEEELRLRSAGAG